MSLPTPASRPEAGLDDNGCTLVEWPLVRLAVAGVPDPERVRVESHGPDHAGCGFGRHRWTDPTGNRLETSAVIVERSGVPDLGGLRRAVSPRGRDVLVGTSTLGDLTVGGHGRGELAVSVAVHEVSTHRILVLVHADYTDVADPLDLIDAVVDDVSLS